MTAREPRSTQQLAEDRTSAMIMGALECVQTPRTLRQFQPIRVTRLSLVIALVMSAAGVLRFFGIIAGLL